VIGPPLEGRADCHPYRKESTMSIATLSDVTDYELTSGDEVQVLRQQLDGRPAEVLVGVAHDGDGAMAALTLAEAAALSERLAELVQASA
jgi:hypothetical protein